FRIDIADDQRADGRHLRPLRARRERPCSRCTTNERDELAPPHGAYPKAKDHELIIALCIAAKSSPPCPRWVIRAQSTGPRCRPNVRVARRVQPIDATPSNLA